MTNDSFQQGEGVAALWGETATGGAGVIDAGSTTFATILDQETAINPLADVLGPGLAISRINGVPITTTRPVDVGFAWVQLREDGWLTVTPDMGYTGQITFDYSATRTASGPDAQGHVVVNVEAREGPAAVTLLNRITAVTEDVSTASALKVADIALADGELDMDGLSLTGLDAGMFKIVDNALYLKEGIELDFKSKPTLSVEILASHVNGFDEGASFALSVASVSGTQALAAASDTFVFSPGYSRTDSEHPLIDLSSSRYTTLNELIDSGALVQEGQDVIIMLNPDDPADLQKIILKGVEMSALSDTDFKFS